MSDWRPLFSRSLAADPARLHLAAHSHHLWPDASRAAQIACWDEAARLADRKWDVVMGEQWPRAQAEVAAELGTDDPSAIVFAGNTHDFIVRLAAACPRRADGPLRIVTTDAEFHSARRQFARWAEDGTIALTLLPADPLDTLSARLAAAAGEADLVFVSQMLFGSGRRVPGLETLGAVARPEGPWVVIDGYHSFMALPVPLGRDLASSCFFLAGVYKYAMAGEGLGLMHCPPGYGPRPPVTGWFAEFGELEAPPGGVGYTKDAMRFMGATFDPSALYRFNAVRAMLAGAGLTTADVHAHVARLKDLLAERLAGTALAAADRIDHPEARFVALRHPEANGWQKRLLVAGVVSDVRGNVLRLGLGLYHHADDLDEAARRLATL